MNIEHGPDYEQWSREQLIRALKDNDVEHQEFRLQNDREWRAKLDHQKALIRELVAALANALTSLNSRAAVAVVAAALAKAEAAGFEP